jgi:hypothetical protein
MLARATVEIELGIVREPTIHRDVMYRFYKTLIMPTSNIVSY